jgi:hypothetical protein
MNNIFIAVAADTAYEDQRRRLLCSSLQAQAKSKAARSSGEFSA